MHKGGGKWVGSNKVVELKKKEKRNLSTEELMLLNYGVGEDS